MATMQDIERETREFAAAKRDLDATMSNSMPTPKRSRKNT